jgi:Putative transposase
MLAASWVHVSVIAYTPCASRPMHTGFEPSERNVPAGRFEDPGGFDRLMRAIASKDWVVYAKRAFGGAAQVYRYLGRYTHRVGIANSRLVALRNDALTFRTKNGKHRHHRADRIPSQVPAPRPARALRQDAPLRPARARQRQHQARASAGAARRARDTRDEHGRFHDGPDDATPCVVLHPRDRRAIACML